MSASKSKKKRKTGAVVSKRQMREEAAAKAKRLNKIITICAIAVTVFFASIVLIFSSNGFYRSATAVKVNDHKYSIADFNFWFYNEYYEYYNECYEKYGSYVSYMVPDINKSFGSQRYNSSMTWADYFEQEALKEIKEITALYDEAKAAGYKLSDEVRKELEERYKQEREAASTAKKSLSAYYSSMYGKGVNETVYKNNLEIFYLASYYAQDQYDSYEYTDTIINNYYDEHKDDFDTIIYRYFYISKDSASEDKNATNEEKLAAAKALAEKMQANIHSEADFIKQAYENVGEKYKEDYEDDDYTLRRTIGTSLPEEYKEWLLSADRQSGDMNVVETDGTGYCLIYYVERDTNDYYTKDVRHLLVLIDEVDRDDYKSDAEYNTAKEKADADALKAAQDYYKEWKDGKATEDSFASLADKNSDDSAEGGLYEQVYKGMMVKPFEEWCFDETRQKGDTEIILTEYGYHIMYFVGDNDNYRSYLVELKLRNDDYEKWIDEIQKDYSANAKFFFSFVG